MNQIPKFFNPSQLRITSAREFEENGRINEMVVQDPEGDQLTITHWTEDTGFAAVMPDRKLSFKFQSGESGIAEEAAPSRDELVKLSYGLSDAQEAQGLMDDGFGMPSPAAGEADPIDSFVVETLVDEVSTRGGVVRGF